MKTRQLNIKDWSGYIFTNVTNINNSDPGAFSYLRFCKSDENKNMLNDYLKVIDGIKEEVLSFIDEFEDEILIMDKDFMRFRFKTNDKLPYNKKNNVPVCVVSMSSVIKKGDWYYPQIKLQECFSENGYI